MDNFESQNLYLECSPVQALGILIVPYTDVDAIVIITMNNNNTYLRTILSEIILFKTENKC